MKPAAQLKPAVVHGMAICLVVTMLCSSVCASEIEIAGAKFRVENGKVVITASHFKNRQLPTEYQSFLFRDSTTIGEFGLISETVTLRDSTKELGSFELKKVVKLRVLHRHSSTSAILVAEVVTTMAGMVNEDRSLYWFDGFDFSNAEEGSEVNLYQQAIIASDLLEYEIPTGELRSVIRILPATLPSLEMHSTKPAIPQAKHPAFVGAKARKWTDHSERQSTIGIPIGFRNGRISIYVEAKNKMFDIDVVRLSTNDQQWIQSQLDKSNALGQATVSSGN